MVLTGIQEKEGDVPEGVVREFLLTVLQILHQAVDKIQLERVHRFGQRGETHECSIVAKFAFFKDKIMVESLGTKLDGAKK